MKRSGGRVLWVVLAVAMMMVQTVMASETTYEKPSAFLKRHFGSIPKARALDLNARQLAGLKALLGHAYGQRRVRYWKQDGKTAWILSETGKTEPITVGFIVEAGKLAEVKVLIYRESHGWEVSRPFFTKQFIGAALKDGKVDRQIDGIVGATLSVRALSKLSAVALYLNQQLER